MWEDRVRGLAAWGCPIPELALDARRPSVGALRRMTLATPTEGKCLTKLVGNSKVDQRSAKISTHLAGGDSRRYKRSKGWCCNLRLQD